MSNHVAPLTDASEARIAADAARLMSLLPTAARDQFERMLVLQLRVTYLDGYTTAIRWSENRACEIIGKAAFEVTP